MLQPLILSTLLLLSSQDTADRMLNAATADQPLVNSVVVNASVRNVWNAWTTEKGITAWMVPSGTIDLRVGGVMRSSYTKGDNLEGKNVIENTIISFDPERMLSIKCTKTPESFPWKKAMANCWTVVYFEALGEAETRVTTRMLGYTPDPESLQMRLFFSKGNQQTLDALAAHFAKKGSSR